MILDEASAFLDTVTKFRRENVAKYGKALGPSAPKGFYHGIVPKVKWGMHGPKDIAKFHSMIGMHANKLSHLMMQLDM
jgi:hypothetical protein